MKDYKSTLVRWITLGQLSDKDRKEILDNLHPEIKKGFDIITKLAIEELEKQTDNKEFSNKAKDTIETLFAFSVFGGYMLFLIENHIDPAKETLSTRESTKSLGTEWMMHYEVDQGNKLLSSVDPIISQMMQTGTGGWMNQLFLRFPECMDYTYKTVSNVEKFINWSAHQGYLFGILEQQLKSSSKN